MDLRLSAESEDCEFVFLIQIQVLCCFFCPLLLVFFQVWFALY